MRVLLIGLVILLAGCVDPSPPKSGPTDASTLETAPSPTPMPTAIPTPEPTSTPESSPTPEPTSTPEPSPTPEPTSTPTPSPTPEPTWTPIPTIDTNLVAWSWFNDGVDGAETLLVEELVALYIRSRDTALAVSLMPFMETVEFADIMAVRSLWWLHEIGGSRLLGVVMGHPALAFGIDDEEAKIVATLHSVVEFGTDEVWRLFAPGIVSVEERRIELPLTGAVDLAVIRTQRGAARSMDLLEHSVRQAEEVMQLPLPTRYVAVLFSDAFPCCAPAINWGTHIISLIRWDVDEDDDAAEYSAMLMAHEVAHYYWRDNAFWVNEGTANLMAIRSEQARTGRPMDPMAALCPDARYLLRLDEMTSTGEEFDFECHYSLSERLFLDLHRNMDEDVFFTGFRRLHQLSVEDAPEDGCLGTRLTDCHVRSAFTGLADSETDDVVDRIVSRWYDGTEAYGFDTRTGEADPTLRSVHGRMDEYWISTAYDGEPEGPTFSISELQGELWLGVRFSYTLESGEVEVPFQVVDYYEDGFAFQRRVESWAVYADSAEWPYEWSLLDRARARRDDAGALPGTPLRRRQEAVRAGIRTGSVDAMAGLRDSGIR